ncbi:MAG TPA: tetratricopeptide repeat protein, partial [Bacteroidia bacterium]|nr:tetratricopeptide repeat protein [Bacteroidia bacterium]
QGKYAEAAEQFARVAAADPQPGVLHNLGNALLHQHKYREAAQAYERSLRLRPGHPETKMNLQMAKKKLQEEAIARITARFEIPEKAYGAQTPDTWIDALSRDLLTTDLSSSTRKALPTPATLKDACIAVCSLPEFQLV